MAFKQRSAPEITADNPEKLFQVLPRTGKSVASLWSHQADILRDYASAHSTARDLAIELPTGTGKTLPGLLIADWRRRQFRGRTVFACPTVQLVRQVVRAATRQGIPVVDLSGSARDWDQADVVRFQAARATAVVTYSSIFNTNPQITDADLILFDDAHAGEQYVSAAYTVSVKRAAHNDVYQDIVEALRTQLGAERYGRLILNTPHPVTRRTVDAVLPALNDGAIPLLDAALMKFADPNAQTKSRKEQSYRYASVRGHLAACILYASWDEISIRPLIPPTFENPTFSSANQRIYLSATLGAAGELERAFGRPSIKRLALPESAGRPKSGRRFVVFPRLVQDADPEAVARSIVEKAGKAIVITPSDYALGAAEVALAPNGWSVFHKTDVEESFEGFEAATDAVCILANRYDGIDLPGSACRAVVLYGHPSATHQQEQFLSSRARSTAAIDERIRSRIVQGTGRCTRGPEDWAVVVIEDPETTAYLAKPEVQSALDEDLQAEVRFGLEQSETTAAELLENVQAFLEQGDAWLHGAEPILSEHRAAAERVDPPAASALSAAATYEVRAMEAAWPGDWKGAAENSLQAAEKLGSTQAARGYRALLLFLAAVYLNVAGRVNGSEPDLKAAVGWAEQSVRAATPATWMREALPLPGAAQADPSPSDLVAVRTISKAVAETTNTGKHEARMAAIHAGLAAIAHEEYEPSLSELGLLLGAEAWKPDGDGRADSVWCWGNELWITLEAKSEHDPSGRIGLDDVRQINHHLQFLSADRGSEIPAGSVSVMISPKQVFKQDALKIADEYTFRVDPALVSELADAAERLWRQLITLRNITDESQREAAVAQTLRDFRLLPSDVLDRLTLSPIKTG